MKDTNTSQEPDIIDRLRGLSVLVVGGIGLDAARCISGLRAELAEANADCKRANELINAAIEDYNEALEKAKLHAADAKTAWAECELLRKEARSALKSARDLCNALMNGETILPSAIAHGIAPQIEDAIRKMGDAG